MNSKIFLFLVLGITIGFASPYLLVMDASGSMDDGLPPDYNETKMEAAKRAANNFIDRTSGEIGLMAFDACDDDGDPYSGRIWVVQDFTTSKALLKSKVNSLEPWSSTPIADALSEARTYIMNTTGYGTIILITDGEETCGGEPVDVADMIYTENVGQVHVIGYLIGGNAEETAKNIAEAGGGEYYSVENAGQLEAALVQISEEDIVCCPAALLIVLPLLGLSLARRN
ncbi:VWA domain-containing protein [Candidatus Micrarchaeota archaeon]|nr:VWA domain-containing protein [Candidatus Micrarchaeota archaeon]